MTTANRPEASQIQHGHHSEETAFIIASYPYGRLRCQKKVWIETVKGKGSRLVEQTQNPKNNRWNKPHKSTYSTFMFLYIATETGYLHHYSLDFYNYKKMEETFAYINNVIGTDNISDLQKIELRNNAALNLSANYAYSLPKYSEEEKAPIKLWLKCQVSAIFNDPFNAIKFEPCPVEAPAMAA